MTKQKSTKRALLLSVLSLLMCVTMFVGSTFAWFTDSVTSAGNKIQSGTLKLDLELLEKKEDGTTTWQSIKESQKAIFDYDKWEPGYVDVKILKVENEGTLALKWYAKLVTAAERSILEDVIDVYVYPSETELTYPTDRDLTGYTKVGTLKEFMNTIETTTNGELAAKESAYLGIALKMQESAGNDYQDKTIGAFDIHILATQNTVEKDSFDELYDEDAEGPVIGTIVTPENIDSTDFTAENEKFTFKGEFGDVSITLFGTGSVLDLDGAIIGNMTLADDATITGKGMLNSLKAARNSEETITITLTDAELDITNELGVRNTDALSVLNIENSSVEFGTIFVGEHTNNQRNALAEFNVSNSYLSGEENGLGSTISVWGRSGVKSTIYDSQIYTYSRGWHQSEDANDNALTFQGATKLDVDIQRSNMHLYGARSIINARQYGSEETDISFKISESLIWSVTKSNHGEETLPVWGATEITDSILLFTKNVYKDTPAVFTSFVYGNPVVHGDYHVTTQCQWDAPIKLSEEQIVTFTKEANVSVYEGAGNVEFVRTGNAKVVLEEGAVVQNINGIK